MMKSKSNIRLILITGLALALILSACKVGSAPVLRAGLRASGYGITPFPKPDWWIRSTASMAQPYEAADPAVIWIVGNAQRGGSCWLNFPIPEGMHKSNYKDIMFAYTDRNEDYLEQFDNLGVKVWLQVEPGSADVEALLKLMLDRYASHPSVIGVGVDVEWLRFEEFHEGKAVSDIEAQAWVDLVQTYNRDYQVFVKHWLPEKLPSTYRTDMLFLNDSQGFESLEQMVSEFSHWGQVFAGGSVGFQYGYASDRTWWQDLSNPPAEIGSVLLESIPNTTDLYWVDFTAEEIWDQDW